MLISTMQNRFSALIGCWPIQLFPEPFDQVTPLPNIHFIICLTMQDHNIHSPKSRAQRMLLKPPSDNAFHLSTANKWHTVMSA